jgi:hypothetical protein
MPVNPNIALGTQPQQPVNYLAQMGQAMALKAASQDIQGNEDLRNFYASGGNAATPEGARALMAANPKMGMQILKNTAETQKIQGDALSKSFANAREGLLMVRTPEDLLNYSISQFSDPLIGPSLKARGLTPETVAANLQKELSTSGFDAVLKKSAMGLDGWYKDQTSRRNQDVSSGASYGQLELSKQEAARKQQELDLVRGILTGNEQTPPATSNVPMGGGGGGPTTGASSSIFNPASANVLANQVAPPVATPAPVNGLLNPPAGQTGVAPAANRIDQITQQLTRLAKVGGPVAGPAMENLIKEYNVLNPEGEIKQNASGALVAVNRRTNVATPILDKDGKPVMGNLPYETAFATTVGKGQGERNEKVVLAAQAAVDNIAKIDSTIELLKKGDATTGLGAELRNNIDRARALFAGDIKANKKVADTQILDALLGSDVFSMIQSLGIGARGLDTPAERDYLRQVMTGTIQMDNKALIRLSEIRRNIETRAIEKYNTQLDKGELKKYFETQGLTPEKIEVPTASGGASSNTVSVGGVTYTFPNAEAAAKFKKEAGVK